MGPDATETDVEVLQDLERSGARPEPAAIGKPWRWFRSFPKLSGLFLLTFVLAAIFASVVAPEHPHTVDLQYRFAPPVWSADGSWARILGADALGRDVLSRIIHGARISLTIGLAAVIITAITGTAIGITAGYLGGRIDSILSGLIDLWLSIPSILFLLLLAMIIGRNIIGIIVAIGILAWPRYARIVRSEVLALKVQDFVSMARVSGTSTSRIMAAHLLPNLVSTVLVLATLDVGRVIVLESALSFLGLGVPPPVPAWGLMVAEGQPQLQLAWWISIMPGLALVATVLSANAIGDWLRDTLDPTTSRVPKPSR